MPTCEAFIAEDVAPASFGRLNFYGVNLGRAVLVPAYPYRLRATFVIVLRSRPLEPIGDVRLRLTSDWWEPIDQDCGPLPAAEAERAFCITWSKLPVLMSGEGAFVLQLTCDGFSWRREWISRKGPGPYRARVTEIPYAGVIDGRRAWNPIADLMMEVRQDILIVEQYITPEFIKDVLPPAGSTWRVRVITAKAMAARFTKSAADLKAAFPGLEVRADVLIHDRFICRDDEDVYAFGHSLKDLLSGRVSFFHRIHDAEQAQAVRSAMEESWNRASLVL